MAYEFPNWIQPPESLSKSYAAGASIAADLASKRASLDLQKSLAEQEMANREAHEQAQLALSRQQLMQQQAYQTGLLGIDQQRLAKDQELANIQLREAQANFDAKKAYEQDVASGMDRIDAIIKNFPGTTWGERMVGFGQLARQRRLDKLASDTKMEVVSFPDANGQMHSFLKAPGTEGFPVLHSMNQSRDLYTNQIDNAYLRDQLRNRQLMAEALLKFNQDPMVVAAKGLPADKITDYHRSILGREKALQDEYQYFDQNIQRFYQQRGYAQPGDVRHAGVPAPQAQGGGMVNMPRVVSVRMKDGTPVQPSTPAPPPTTSPGVQPSQPFYSFPSNAAPTTATEPPPGAAMVQPPVAPSLGVPNTSPTVNYPPAPALPAVWDLIKGAAGNLVGPSLNDTWAADREAQHQARAAEVQEALNQVMKGGAVTQFTPDYTTGRNANPEDYVPYDPNSGIPTY